MDLRQVFLDGDACPSVVWEAVSGAVPGAATWEPEALRLELARRGVQPSEAAMAKLLAAQTVVATDAWAHDHDVLFAFALACDGVPAAADAFHHPTPELLAWAVDEINALGKRPTPDEGFDPAEVDPAVAAVLLDDGFAVAPDWLAFAQDALDALRADHDDALADRVRAAWNDLAPLAHDDLRRKAEDLGDGPVDAQLKRLAGVRLYLAERQHARARQHAAHRHGPGA